MPARLVLVVVLLLGLVIARRMYLGWRASLHREERAVPRLPQPLVAGAARTWVVFTTPYCATCGPVAERLRSHDPDAQVVTVDATAEPALAKAFHVRSAPTVLLADHAGEVQTRLVGASAVNDYVRSPA